MKKLLITAIIAVAAFGVSFGQANGSHESDQSTNHQGGVWVQCQNAVTLNIKDVITIACNSVPMTANFNNAADLSAAKNVGTATFAIQSNRVFDVCVKAGSANFTATNIDAGIFGNNPGDITTMPASVLSMALTANNTLGSSPFALNAYQGVPTTNNYSLGNGGGPGNNYGNLLILDGMPGGLNVTSNTNTTRTFDVAYKANPGWAYAGGTYALNVVYTAAQE